MPLPPDVRERAIISAARFACLSFHCPDVDPAYTVTKIILNDLHAAGRHVDELAVEELVAAVAAAHTNTEGMAVQRIKAAIEGKTGPSRLIAAYRANAGVLTPADVESMAAP